jgi:hypothetical protein
MLFHKQLAWQINQAEHIEVTSDSSFVYYRPICKIKMYLTRCMATICTVVSIHPIMAENSLLWAHVFIY